MVIDSANAYTSVSPNPKIVDVVAPPAKSLLLLSGSSVPAITKMSTNYGEYLEKNPTHRNAMVHTLASRRERLRLASYSIVDDLAVAEPAAPLEDQGVRRVAFVFTGQGAQWAGMGREMMRENAEFAASIRRMDEVLKSLEHPPTWTLEDTFLTDGADKELLSPTDRSQPICTAAQVAYVDALAAWNVHPSAVVGHSSGEVAAAYAAGVLTSREAIVTAYYRGYACARNTVPGGMAAVGMSRDKVEFHIQPGVVVACENSNASVTISGDVAALDSSMTSIRQAYPDVFVRALRVPMGYHSHHMRTIADLYNSLIKSHLSPRTPQIPYYSTVYGRQVREAKVFGPQYWQLNMESPVLFRTAVSQMLTDMGRDTAHLEIGPHSALAGPLRHIYKEAGHATPYASVAERGEDAARTFLQAVGKLYTFGLLPTPPAADDSFVLPELPTYPWNYETRHWSETRVMADWRFRQHRKHELLGLRVLESSDVEPAWRNLLRLADVAWLGDHCVGSDIVFPAAGYIAMAGVALGQLTGSTSYTVKEVNVAAAMLLTEYKSTEIVTVMRRHALTSTNDSKWWEFSVSSENGGVWTKHCWGLVTEGCAVVRPTPKAATYARKVDARRWSTALSRIGLNYGPRFIGLQDITASPVEAVAAVTITDRQDEGEPYALHPSTLDLILQSWSVAATHGEYRHLDTTFLPTFIENFFVGAAAGKTLQVQSTSRGIPGSALGDSYGVVDGDIGFVMHGFKGTKMEGSLGQQAPEQTALSIQWHPAVDFAPVHTLIRPTRDATAEIQFVERFAVMVTVEISCELPNVTSLAQPHFHHFVAGIGKSVDAIDRGESMVSDAAAIKAMTREARQAEMMALRKQSLGGPVEAITETLWRVCTHIKEVLEGQEVYLDLLLADDVLTRFYNESNDLSDISDWFRVLGLNRPQLRVLEIGAGTGGTTAGVLATMQSDQGERLYQDYTITDVSAGFVARCKERFQHHPNLKYAVLDITVDPLEQGFDAASFDLILASNVSCPTSRYCRRSNLHSRSSTPHPAWLKR